MLKLGMPSNPGFTGTCSSNMLTLHPKKVCIFKLFNRGKFLFINKLISEIALLRIEYPLHVAIENLNVNEKTCE